MEGVQNQSRPKQVAGIFESVREYRSRMADPTDEQLRGGQCSAHGHSDKRYALSQREFSPMLLC
jgi:hypothetical protein